MKKPRRVLHVIDSFDLGGAQTFLLDLVRHLDPGLFVAEVAAMHGNGVFEKEFHKAGIVTHSLSPGKFPPYYFVNFLRLVHRQRYDILHFHLFGANLCAKPLAYATGYRSIVVHDQCNDASRSENPLLLAADALANRSAARVIAVSESVCRYLLEYEDLPESKLQMIPNGIDAKEFQPPTQGQRKSARAMHSLPEECFVIGGVGRFVAQKNFRAFIEVASQIRANNPNAVFLLAGSGPMERELKAQARQLGLGDSVRFLGHVHDRISLYQSLDALLMPSDFEGTPMALLEAMASGVPVVASRVDGIDEVCSHGVDALLVPAGDIAGYTRSLERLITDKPLRQQIAENARKTILDRYEIGTQVTQVEQLYEEVLAQHTD